MQKYRVLECRVDDFKMALKCNNGRYHLTRVLNVLPPIGLVLHGAKAHLGFGVLVCPASGAVFRVIFESINNPSPVFDAEWVPKPAQPAIAAASRPAAINR